MLDRILCRDTLFQTGETPLTLETDPISCQNTTHFS